MSIGLNGSLSYTGYIGGSKDTYHYKNDFIDAIINFNNGSKRVHGDVSTSTGEFYYLEYCGSHQHTLKRMNVQQINKKRCLLLDPKRNYKRSIDFSTNITTSSRISNPELLRYIDSSNQAEYNHVIINTFSVKIYYTPQFSKSTPDLKGYFKQVIDKTNQGYINSKVPVRVKLFCYQMTTFHEKNNLKAQIYEFAVMEKTTADLLGTADAAVLFVQDDPYACGVVLSYRSDFQNLILYNIVYTIIDIYTIFHLKVRYWITNCWHCQSLCDRKSLLCPPAWSPHGTRS